MREAIDSGATSAVMEVSSHALHQKRVDGLRFAVAAFTNLSGDHLDYHGTLEQYADSKARLFERLDEEAVAIVNADDAAGERMMRDCTARVVRYSLNDSSCAIHARITRESVDGTHYVMTIDGQDMALENAVVGRHNVYNAMAAAGLATALGATPGMIADGLASVRNVPGRLQRVPCTEGFHVFVDYAHTDDALENVLRVVRTLTRRRLIVVFGCGGDRDRTKRPRMGRVAAELADCVVATSDNPRSESPRKIIEDILAGMSPEQRGRTTVEPDRRAAICGALIAAMEGDVVLIAGKGHEDYQILGDKRIHFDDIEVAIEALALRAGCSNA
jgi:UDP-N-acetylmuramoyl-L-alanyl-D-glutamate--2,6-diaminopimelate ligase